MQPKLPWGKKPRKPGSGLGQLFGEDEPITSKMAALPPTPTRKIHLCPSCKGSTFESIEELTGPSLGQYRVVRCESCDGRGEVTESEAAAILARMEAKPRDT